MTRAKLINIQGPPTQGRALSAGRGCVNQGLRKYCPSFVLKGKQLAGYIPERSTKRLIFLANSARH